MCSPRRRPAVAREWTQKHIEELVRKQAGGGGIADTMIPFWRPPTGEVGQVHTVGGHLEISGVGGSPGHLMVAIVEHLNLGGSGTLVVGGVSYPGQYLLPADNVDTYFHVGWGYTGMFGSGITEWQGIGARVFYFSGGWSHVGAGIGWTWTSTDPVS